MLTNTAHEHPGEAFMDTLHIISARVFVKNRHPQPCALLLYLAGVPWWASSQQHLISMLAARWQKKHTQGAPF